MSHNLTDAPAFNANEVQVPDDGDTANAVSVTAGFQKLANRTAYLNNQRITINTTGGAAGVSAAVANFDSFMAHTAIGAGETMQLAFWHPYLEEWLACVNTAAPSSGVYFTHDNGRTWAAVSPAVSTSGIFHAAVAIPGAASFVIFTNGPGGPGFVNQANTFNAVAGLTNVATPAALYLLNPGLQFYGISMSGGTYTGYLAQSSVTTGASWSIVTNTLPAIWQSGTCHLNGVVSCSSTLAVNGVGDPSGPRTLIAMCAVTPTTDVGRLLQVNAGGLFTDSSPAFLATRVVTAVAYGASDNLWGVLCNDGTNSYLYTSPDLSTWTLVHTFTGMTKSAGLAVTGFVWSAQVANATDNRVMYSGDLVDGAASIWSTSNAFLTSGLLVGGGNTLVSSGYGLIGWNGTNLHFSRQIGFMPNGAY